MNRPTIAAMGERALLATLPGLDAVLTAYLDLDRAPLPGQRDLVTGGRTLLVVFDSPVDPSLAASLSARLAALHPLPASAAGDDRITIDVCYDSADLPAVAALIGMTESAVITAHTAADWRVAFGGFAPGFSYLTCDDPRLTVPRRDNPRTEVPAGSVGLAGPYSGIYPRPSPGGWQLIGRTAAPLWDVDRDPPALLQPGMRVVFRAVREQLFMTPPRPPAREPAGVGTGAPALTVRKPGMQLLVQDLGRVGYESAGVSPSGAADRGAAVVANRLVGNDDDAAVLEILFGGAEFVAEGPVAVALAGAPTPISVISAEPSHAPDTDPGTAPSQGRVRLSQTRAEIHTRPRQTHAPAVGKRIELNAGDRLVVGRPATGLRSYLAVAGGFDIAPVLGSRSTDTLSGLGPAAVRAGDVLPVGPLATAGPRSSSRDVTGRAQGPTPARDRTDSPAHDQSESAQPTLLAATPGPQWGEFADPTALAAADWTVSTASDRIGVRLTGPALHRTAAGEIPSQGLVRGAVQVPPSGQPIIFLADHPVTGGYPVIAVITDTDPVAQLRPGQVIRIDVRGGTAR